MYLLYIEMTDVRLVIFDPNNVSVQREVVLREKETKKQNIQCAGKPAIQTCELRLAAALQFPRLPYFSKTHNNIEETKTPFANEDGGGYQSDRALMPNVLFW